jgi:pimeloyl-ACP methyl ester carboxylesterase
VLSAIALAAVLATTVHAQGTATHWDGCTSGPGDVRLTAADGERLVGHQFGTGTVGIVLVHTSRGNLCDWAPYANRLARLGYMALAVDLRGHGQSQRNGPAGRPAGDAVAAAEWLRARGARKVFLLGASLGGSVAIDAAAETRRPIAGVISVSGAASLFGTNEAVRRVRSPLLLLAGRWDVIYASDARRLYRAAVATHDKKLAIIAKSGYHGVELVRTSPEARRLIESFLRNH